MCGGVSYCIAPTSLPSVSRKRIRAPTVGITAFGNVTLPPCSLDGRGDGVDVGDGEGGLEPVQAAAGARLAARVQEALDAGVVGRAGVDEVEARRAPRLELPTEDGLVEPAGAVDVVDVDGEGRQVVRHGFDGSQEAPGDAIALSCQLMSRKRRTVADEPFLVVRTSAADLGGSIGEHVHDWHQLVHVRSGLAVVRSDERTWLAPPTWAVWMPAGVRHAIRFAGPTALRVVYLRADPPRRGDATSQRPWPCVERNGSARWRGSG